MKTIVLTCVLTVLSVFIVAQSTTHYYVNIDNAPNGTASGTMKVFTYGDPYPQAIADLTFVENYDSDLGGRYMSSIPLTQSTAFNWIVIQCQARRHWDQNRLMSGYSRQIFKGDSAAQVPTLHLEDPQTPATDPGTQNRRRVR